MKLTILQQDLLPGLQAISRSIGARAALPVLANVLMTAESGNLSLSATNLEIGIVRSLKASVQESGALTVPAKTLLEVVSSLNGLEITLEGTDEQLKISTKNFSATLNGIPATEFPSIPLVSDQNIKVSAKILQKILPEVTFAAAADDGRPILTGILTQIKKQTLELVATDGFRLAHKTIPIEQDIDLDVLIPRRTFEEIVRIVNEEKDIDEMTISTSENQNQIIFNIGQTQISSRLIEGQFPAWEKIIPQKFENKATLDKDALLKAVKLASLFARDNANVIKLEVGTGSIKITSEARELGGQETQIDAQTEGVPLTIAFNSKFLIDALNACPTDQVLVEFSGSLSATLIKPIGESGLEYVVMPVRLS